MVSYDIDTEVTVLPRGCTHGRYDIRHWIGLIETPYLCIKARRLPFCVPGRAISSKGHLQLPQSPSFRLGPGPEMLVPTWHSNLEKPRSTGGLPGPRLEVWNRLLRILIVVKVIPILVVVVVKTAAATELMWRLVAGVVPAADDSAN